MTLDELAETSLRHLPPADEARIIRSLARLRAGRLTNDEPAARQRVASFKESIERGLTESFAAFDARLGRP